MNRAERRANRRRLVAALRGSGCTCSPDVLPDRAEPGVPEAGWVAHAAGCPLLGRLAAAGYQWPTLVFEPVRRCER